MTTQSISSTTMMVSLSVVFGMALVIGLLVGSFLNVVVYRIPRGLSVSKPRSFCPTCQRQLAWWENVPLVSWVALRGRCRTCREAISIRYPLVEAGTAGAFVLIAWARHGSLMTIPYCLLVATIITILLIDAGELRSPLLVAALGTAIADLVLVTIAADGGHWSLLVGAQAGTLAGIVGFSALRRMDPGCHCREGFGRSALIPAGCWLGGLGLVPAGIGAGVFFAVFLLCIAFNRKSGKITPRSDENPTISSSTGLLHRVIGLPMVVSVALGTAVGLAVFA
jgi:leader peptidase (prepilin peptidase)/N-methyltransferase